MSRAIARHTDYRRILDGTMLHNSPLHAFAQFELLEKAALGYNQHADFLAHFADTELVRRGRNWVPEVIGLKNESELRDLIAQYSSVVLREDVDLPPLVPHLRRIEPSREMRKAYEQAEDKLDVEVATGARIPINEQASKILKLQQIAGGWLIDGDGTPHKLGGINPRLEAISEDIYMASGKSIVWCQFKHEIREVATRLRADGWEVLEYHGGVSDEDKATVRTRFPNETDKVILVGQPQAGGRGLQLPASSIFWYSHTSNTIIRAQADERASVMGGAAVNLTDYQVMGVDRYMLDRLAQNMSVADDIAGRGLKAVLAEIRQRDKEMEL
jgi:hypothetical protein